MATQAAKQLIWDLRNDPVTREHFSIMSWEGSGRCNTVGCIAGTAILQERQRELGLKREIEKKYDQSMIFTIMGYSGGSIIKKAQKILGIEFYQTACDLFLPWNFQIEILREARQHFSYLPSQAQPTLETVEQMVEWAKSFSTTEFFVSPDIAAEALEAVTVGEVPYCNWAEAFARHQTPDTKKEPQNV